MRRKAPRVGFADMPAALRDLPLDAPAELKQARADWLEGHGLALVDFLSWKRSQGPLARLPSRRKLLPPAALRELDERLEREQLQW